MAERLPWPTAEDESYDIRIARDGTWFYRGTPIRRPALVKLFSTVLKKDAAGDYWLVTPAEKGRIRVEDTPFLAVGFTVTGSALVFCTNLDEEISAGPDHPVYIRGGVPYLLVRDNLEARLVQSVYYQLVDHALKHGSVQDGVLTVTSRGETFKLGNV